MKRDIRIADLCAGSGMKAAGLITVPGTSYELPLTIINGVEDGKIFLVSAGVHGCEYPGIQATVELARELDPCAVSGAVIFVHAVNAPGFFGRRAYVCPADEESKNFNHISPGNRNGTTAERVSAFFFTEIVPQCDLHLDIHSGDIVEDLEEFIAVCNSPDPKVVEYCTEIARHTSFTHRINSRGRTELYNASAIDCNVPGLLFERGGAGRVKRHEIDRDKADIISICRYIGILEGEPVDNTAAQIFYPRHHWGEAGHTGLFYRFVKTGDEIKKGQKLGEIRDFFGNLLEEIFAEFDGRVKIANNTLGISAGDDTFMYGSTR